MTTKVRAGATYVFDATFYDIIHPSAEVKNGDVVRVVNLKSAPKANTMGQCHIESLDGTFLGMVSTASLTPAKKTRKAA